MARSTQRNIILQVYDNLDCYGINIHNLSQKCGIAWESTQNALEILKALNIVYQDDKNFYALLHKPKDLFQQLESMNKLLEKKNQYIDNLELRLFQLKFKGCQSAKTDKRDNNG